MNNTTVFEESPIPARVKRCWLHVGMHKTGSTSIQNTLAKVNGSGNWRLLRVGGRANMGKAICAMFSAEPLNHSFYSKLGYTDKRIKRESQTIRRRLERALQGCTEETVIISAEALSALLRTEEVQAMKEFLEQFCDEIRVIGYVRPPVSFKNSIFQEAVKHGKGKFNIAEVKVNYRRRFKKFDDVFGRENVILRKFDPASFPHHCIVADFCQQIGIEEPPREAVLRTNESLTREACGILYAYRKFGPGFGVGRDVVRENIRVLAALQGVSGPRFKGSSNLMTGPLAAEVKDIRWIEKRLDASLKEAVKDHGTEVDSEEDLLRVHRSSCVAMVEQFRKLYRMKIHDSKIPKAEYPAAEEIAALVDYCRSLCRDQIQDERAAQRGWYSLTKRRIRKALRLMTGRSASLPPKLTASQIMPPSADSDPTG